MGHAIRNSNVSSFTAVPYPALGQILFNVSLLSLESVGWELVLTQRARTNTSEFVSSDYLDELPGQFMMLAARAPGTSMDVLVHLAAGLKSEILNTASSNSSCQHQSSNSHVCWSHRENSSLGFESSDSVTRLHWRLAIGEISVATNSAADLELVLLIYSSTPDTGLSFEQCPVGKFCGVSEFEGYIDTDFVGCPNVCSAGKTTSQNADSGVCSRLAQSAFCPLECPAGYFCPHNHSLNTGMLPCPDDQFSPPGASSCAFTCPPGTLPVPASTNHDNDSSGEIGSNSGGSPGSGGGSGSSSSRSNSGGSPGSGGRGNDVVGTPNGGGGACRKIQNKCSFRASPQSMPGEPWTVLDAPCVMNKTMTIQNNQVLKLWGQVSESTSHVRIDRGTTLQDVEAGALPSRHFLIQGGRITLANLMLVHSVQALHFDADAEGFIVNTVFGRNLGYGVGCDVRTSTPHVALINIPQTALTGSEVNVTFYGGIKSLVSNCSGATPSFGVATFCSSNRLNANTCAPPKSKRIVASQSFRCFRIPTPYDVRVTIIPNGMPSGPAVRVSAVIPRNSIHLGGNTTYALIHIFHTISENTMHVLQQTPYIMDLGRRGINSTGRRLFE
jgi:hypothetical protein